MRFVVLLGIVNEEQKCLFLPSRFHRYLVFYPEPSLSLVLDLMVYKSSS